ncbi:MAG: hypothetical protein Q8K79_19115, partial [Solirubrobacteraceae bacterium]|nr:hypothetical protein [Solirubrobacteraceae bacterium]
MAGKTPILDDPPERRVTFPDLVRIHFRWRQALRYDSDFSEEERTRLDREYHEALAIFEDEHGQLVNAYWCADVESAVALTAGKPNTGWIRRVLSVSPRFHRVSDWATRDEPEIARALHHCDELAIRAGEVLRGRSRRIAIQLVMTSACHLLSLVDARGENPPQAHRAAVAAELRELAAVGRSYRESANGDAQLVYFAGMAVGIGALGLLYLAAGSILDREGVDAETIVGCLVAGALGAVVSVIARVNSGSFALDEDIARGYTLFLGSLRPWIGSIFGLLIYFAVTSNFVQIFQVPEDGTKAFYFFCVLAFGAGFSERWAQDTLTGGLTGKGRGKADAAAPAAPAPPPGASPAGVPPAAPPP